MKNLLLFAIGLFTIVNLTAQKQTPQNKPAAKPKLVVGLVIDQMRWDYLHRFADRYSNNGFKRLMNEGFNCNNTFINYTPTYTAAGHACIYTGSVPAIHGIMGNYWYSRKINRSVYCTDDSTVTTVGSTSSAGNMSPVNMIASTISDEVRLSTNFRSKVIGVAIKDRGSILPAGHSANGAYWFDPSIGGFVTSTYYMNELPAWVLQFNQRNLPDQYLAKNWNTLYPINTYTQSTADNKAYENNLPGEDNVFPHITNNISGNKYGSFRYTPYANTYTFDMAKAAVEGEQLGNDEYTDVLAISLSSTDYIGHEFGPNSIEMEDTYLRLDKDIADFLTYLDNKIGKDQYTLFLSSDHGAAHVPGFLRENKIPAGVLSSRSVTAFLNKFLQNEYNIANGISQVTNYQVYLNYDAFKGKNLAEIRTALINHLLTDSVIVNAYDLANLNNKPIPAKIKEWLINGYNQQLSGDIQFVYRPHFFDGSNKGTTHGVWNNYDSHIPLIWYGWGVKKGSTWRNTSMTDISATLAALLHVQMPSGCIGNVIEEVMK